MDVVVIGCVIATVSCIGIGVGLVRRVRSNAQRIAYLETRMREVGEIEAIMARSQQDGRRRGHLRLLGLAPLAWVGASVGRRTVAAAAAAIVASTFAMGGPDHKPWQPGTTPADANPIEPAAPVTGDVPGHGWGPETGSASATPQPAATAAETLPTSVESTTTTSPPPTTLRPTTTTTLLELPTETTLPTVETTVPEVCLGNVPLSAPIDLCPGRP